MHRVTGLCTGNSPVIGEFPTQKASNAENVSIQWRHRAHRMCINSYEYVSYLLHSLRIKETPYHLNSLMPVHNCQHFADNLSISSSGKKIIVQWFKYDSVFVYMIHYTVQLPTLFCHMTGYIARYGLTTHDNLIYKWLCTLFDHVYKIYGEYNYLEQQITWFCVYCDSRWEWRIPYNTVRMGPMSVEQHR